MPKLPMLQIDAFTTTPYGGNPCAVVLDADGLSDSQMLAIAREMNLSETAFVLKPASLAATVRARYFTPAEEIPLAGHPTIATTHALLLTGRLPDQAQLTTIRLQLEAGIIPVTITPEGGQRWLIRMTQLAPRFLRQYDAAQVLPAFGLRAGDALPGVPVQTVSTGTPQLMIPVCSLEALRRAQPDVPRYAALRASGDFFSPHLFCLGGVTARGATFARHFGLPPDTMEDPFTGSATGGMAAYLWHHGLLDEPRFVAEQGHWMQRPGEALVEIDGPRQDIRSVSVSGYAVEVLRGELLIPGL